MWLSEDKLKGKKAHFRLPSASQKTRVLKLPIIKDVTRGKLYQVEYTGNFDVIFFCLTNIFRIFVLKKTLIEWVRW